jgi:hypothetical protein
MSPEQVTSSEIDPQVSLILTYWPARVVVASDAAGEQLNTPNVLAIEVVAPIVTSANGIG